jgi:hypothetical protein
MTTITIDGKEYDFEVLPAAAKAELSSLQFVEQELVRLQFQTAALQTARNAYATALKAQLAPSSDKGK